MNSIIEGVREFFLSCPLLDGKTIRVNYLAPKPVEYTIDEVPCEPVVKQYFDGSSRRQTLFVLASKDAYSRDAVKNMAASQFFESLSDWMEKETVLNHLPSLPAGCTAQSVKAITNGYAFSADEQNKTQRYQIQCKLIYFKEAF